MENYFVNKMDKFMKKICRIIIVVLIFWGICSCAKEPHGPTKLKLYADDVFSYIKMDVTFENCELKITTKPASPAYTFSDYTGFTCYLRGKTVIDQDIYDWHDFKIFCHINNDGTCEIKHYSYYDRVQAIVFDEIWMLDPIDGYVIIDGDVGEVDGGYNFLSNERQNEIFQTYVHSVPQPGDENYGSEGCLYGYTDYLTEEEAYLRSCDGGDVICASRSYKHNNVKVTEIGSGSPLCMGSVNGQSKNYNSRIKSFQFSKYTKKINRYAFSSATNLKSISMPDTLEYIGVEAFYRADLSESVRMSNNLKTIEKYAFSHSKIKVIFIPASVTFIGEHAFSHCDELTVIYVEAPSKPDSWDSLWDYYKEESYKYYRHNVVWGATRNQAERAS